MSKNSAKIMIMIYTSYPHLCVVIICLVYSCRLAQLQSENGGGEKEMAKVSLGRGGGVGVELNGWKYEPWGGRERGGVGSGMEMIQYDGHHSASQRVERVKCERVKCESLNLIFIYLTPLYLNLSVARAALSCYLPAIGFRIYQKPKP